MEDLVFEVAILAGRMKVLLCNDGMVQHFSWGYVLHQIFVPVCCVICKGIHYFVELTSVY